jgi:hypothetical protein
METSIEEEMEIEHCLFGKRYRRARGLKARYSHRQKAGKLKTKNTVRYGKRDVEVNLKRPEQIQR